MADMYYYNDVLLPEIPTVDGYPYAMLEKLEASSRWYLVLSNKKYWYNAGYSNPYICASGTSVKNYAITFAELAAGGTWVLKSETAYTQAGPVVWTNYDIPKGSSSSTTIYFPATNAYRAVDVFTPEEFAVSKESLTAIADAIRSKTGKTEGLTLAQMAEEIAGIQPAASEAE